jgi:alkyldihydroxyacetonephosphate synthase
MDSILSGIATSTERLDRHMASHDLWPRRFLERREEMTPELPARVYWPENTLEVQRVVQAAAADSIAVVPYGAGSGVCGGIAPGQEAWIIDTKRLNRVVEIDEAGMTCTVEAGLIGERLERILNARGFSLGHFPSSIYCSTVGGWVATRSAGQLSSRYGKIEDLVLELELVDGAGNRLIAKHDDPKTGPAALRLFIGSEASLCVITKIVFRIHRLAQSRWLRGFLFPDLPQALESMRHLLQTGCGPSVLRLYDPLDTFLSGGIQHSSQADLGIEKGAISQAGLEHSGPAASTAEPGFLDELAAQMRRIALFSNPEQTQRLVGSLLSRPLVANMVLSRLVGGTKLIVGLEGDEADLLERAPAVQKCMSGFAGKDIGQSLGLKWLKQRHRVSYKMSHVFAAGGWVDTMEVAIGWDGVVPLYHAFRNALRDIAIVMCHFSHAYIDGCSLYFTFSGGGHKGQGKRSALARYDLAWQRALTIVRQHGAALSHHHGIGRSKKDSLQHSSGSQFYLSALKETFDPHGIMNPGVLGLGGKE